MSASDNGPDGRKERYRRGATFLRAARHLPELTPAQIDRIERHLNRARPVRVRRPILSPALAALVVVLVAGAALAVAGMSLTRLPGIGPWIGALFPPAPARKASPSGHPRRADGADPNDVAALAAPARRAPAVPADRVPAFPAERPPAPPVGRAPELPAAHAPAVPAAHPSARPARAEVAPSPGATTSASNHPRRRQPDATVAWAAAPPAGERDPERSPAIPSPAAAGTASATIETAATEAASTARPTPPPTAPLPTTPPAAESPIVADSRSFASALERWHRDHDAKAALAALDAHERRFPAGEFRLEGQLLRAEILLAGGHEREGLALLDPLALAGLPRARELRTVRGELRVKFGRCPEGKTDLAAVLAESGNDPLAQRARQALVDCP